MINMIAGGDALFGFLLMSLPIIVLSILYFGYRLLMKQEKKDWEKYEKNLNEVTKNSQNRLAYFDSQSSFFASYRQLGKKFFGDGYLLLAIYRYPNDDVRLSFYSCEKDDLRVLLIRHFVSEGQRVVEEISIEEDLV